MTIAVVALIIVAIVIVWHVVEVVKEGKEMHAFLRRKIQEEKELQRNIQTPSACTREAQVGRETATSTLGSNPKITNKIER